MKLKSLFLLGSLALGSSAFAATHISHPLMTEADKTASARTMAPDYCEVELVNNSYETVRIFGVFDDGSPLTPVDLPRFSAPIYVDLFYNGYCHQGMNIYIFSLNGVNLYSAFTPVHTTVSVYPFLKGLKVDVADKQ